MFKLTTITRYQYIYKKIGIGMAVMLLVENGFLIANNLQNKRPVLGLKVAGQTVSSLDRPQLQQLVSQIIQIQSQVPLRLSYNQQIYEIKRSDVGAVIDSAEATNQLLQTGREGSWLSKIVAQHQALLGQENLHLKGVVSQTLLNLKILTLQSEINRDAQPIRPDFQGDINKTLPAEEGVQIDTNKLTVFIADNIFNPPAQAVPIPTTKTFTTHSEDELVPIRKQALRAIQLPISITSGGLKFTLSPADLRSLLTVVERSAANDPTKLVLQLRLDDKKLNQKLGDFAQQVESVTGAEFDDHDARVAIYAQFGSGKHLTYVIPTGQKKVLGVNTDPSVPKTAYLTFDDGPNSIYHPMILDILKTKNVRATFFLVGKNTQADLEVAKRTIAEGHVIGNHSLTHAFLPNLTSNNILREIDLTDSILKPLNGDQEPIFFRPPYGGVSLAVKNGADTRHLKLVLWDVDPRDWSEPNTDELVRRVVSNTFNGADILMHSNHLSTVKALPTIIDTLRSQGYTFDTLH